MKPPDKILPTFFFSGKKCERWGREKDSRSHKEETRCKKRSKESPVCPFCFSPDYFHTHIPGAKCVHFTSLPHRPSSSSSSFALSLSLSGNYRADVVLFLFSTCASLFFLLRLLTLLCIRCCRRIRMAGDTYTRRDG